MLFVFIWSLKNISAVISITLLCIIGVKTILGLFLGGFDIDLDGDGSTDIDMSSISVPKGIAWFLCAFCGYVALTDKMTPADWGYATLCGVASMLLIWLVYWGMYKLGKSDQRETPFDAVGKPGSVTVTNADGTCGYMFVTLNGAPTEVHFQLLESSLPVIKGDVVEVKEYNESAGVFIVEKFNSNIQKNQNYDGE